ncbi:hypothetical protein JTE90_005121 [Oedothorax gibbosus]|uniref:EGF-like domain-containing protein n=1 Tax=Oedothorax gibbosus TaxID=931172 RepID=A0AAV6ULN4_9ARAC|nr:hypothetical protein JTE90_005121 [Oedothorax gibbosus]
MNVFMLGILVCLSSFWCKALAIYIASNDTVLNDANSSNVQSTFIIKHGVGSQEKTSQYIVVCNGKECQNGATECNTDIKCYCLEGWAGDTCAEVKTNNLTEHIAQLYVMEMNATKC